jgi:hypothetical protein
LVDSSAAHGVQVYAEPSELAASVSSYVASGLNAGDSALVIGTAEQTTVFVQDLTQQGLDVEGATAEGALVLWDADRTLAKLMEKGVLSAQRFGTVVGGALDEMASRFPGRRIRAFGAMVDLLAKRREAKTAVALEELWNDLLDKRGDFSLLCAYRLDIFDVASQRSAMPQICATHSHVRPAADDRRFANAVDQALEDVLGYEDAGKVYVCISQSARDGRIPVSQLALMWVSENMPTRASRIIACARARYSGAPLVPVTG